MPTEQTMKKDKVRVLFCDQLNLARGKYLPHDFASNGEARLCKGVYGVTYSRQMVAAPGSGVEDGLPDVSLHFDPSQYRAAWEDGTQIAIADVYEDGRPSELCGRSALKRAIEAWKKHGLEPMIGFESEAYIFEKSEAGLKPYNTPGSFVYGTGPFNDPQNLMEEIWQKAAECGIPLESLNAEFDAPQYEMTLKYGHALKACDDFFLFRNLARELLYKRGYLLSFLPKPLSDVGGSGLHLNISFRNKDGKNELAEGTREGSLSALTKGVIAGLIQHHEALGGVLAPTMNSYERLKPGSMCGYWANWGFDNRGVAIRISSETGSAARIEHRVADCSASPYLAAAAILQAALLGYEKRYELPPPEKAGAFKEVSATRHIQSSLSASLQALRNDSDLACAIGQGLISNYCAIKEAESKELENANYDEIVAYYAHFI